MIINNYFNISNESLEEYFLSIGVPKNLAKILMRVSQNDEKKILKKDPFCFNNEDYNQEEFNVFIYDTCRYPPNSNSHKTLN